MFFPSGLYVTKDRVRLSNGAWVSRLLPRPPAPADEDGGGGEGGGDGAQPTTQPENGGGGNGNGNAGSGGQGNQDREKREANGEGGESSTTPLGLSPEAIGADGSAVALLPDGTFAAKARDDAGSVPICEFIGT